jgi:hypothetical protein
MTKQERDVQSKLKVLGMQRSSATRPELAAILASSAQASLGHGGETEFHP